MKYCFLVFSIFGFLPSILAENFGDTLWTYETGGAVVGSPAVDSSGNIYFGSIDGSLYSLDKDGNLRWEYDTTDWVESSPALSRDEATVYVGSWSNSLVAVNAATGELLWEFATGSLIYSSPAVAEDGTIYFGSSDGFLYALDGNGDEKWELDMGGEIDSSPAIDDSGNVYVGGNEGTVSAVSPEGSLLWNTDIPLEPGAFLRERGVTASPMLTAEGDLIIGCENFYIYCLDTSDGSIRWRVPTNAEIGGSCVEGMGRTFVVSGKDGFLYSFDWDGNLEWKKEIGENLFSTPCVDSFGRIYAGSVGANESTGISVFSSDGQKRWETALGSFVDASPVLTPGGTLLVGNNDKKLYAIKGGGGLASLGWSSFGGNDKGWASLEGYVDLSDSRSSYLISELQGPMVVESGLLSAELIVQGGGAMNVSIRGLSAELADSESGAVPLVTLSGLLGQMSATEDLTVLPWEGKTINGWLEPGEYRIELALESAEDSDGFVLIESQ